MEGYVQPELLLLLVMSVPGAAGGWLAYNRGRNFIGWCILCALFPVFLLVIYYNKPLREVPGKFKRCRSCSEWLKWRDPVCKYCNASQPAEDI
ncbi:hypothetical protein [Geobacter sp. DSM 9736]|uniref:hypothetical protein n=1 Tax=Geobacter sp. DSM 9736 TaxID=1277350 RepID=UPI000B50F3CE|nr:hypothetical protein [Geobacter sp. DSM 9736]SNB46582.1 hypothetical protein SAMN06269301_2050 [Geobacter sp. DSM 9736]